MWIIDDEGSSWKLVNFLHDHPFLCKRQVTPFMRSLYVGQDGSAPIAFYFTRVLFSRIVAWVSWKQLIKNIDNFSTTCHRSHPTSATRSLSSQFYFQGQYVPHETHPSFLSLIIFLKDYRRFVIDLSQKKRLLRLLWCFGPSLAKHSIFTYY